MRVQRPVWEPVTVAVAVTESYLCISRQRQVVAKLQVPSGKWQAALCGVACLCEARKVFNLKFNKRKQLHKFSQPSNGRGRRKELGGKGKKATQQDRLESPDTQSWYRGRRLGATDGVGLGAEEEEGGG